MRWGSLGPGTSLWLPTCCRMAILGWTVTNLRAGVASSLNLLSGSVPAGKATLAVSISSSIDHPSAPGKGHLLRDLMDKCREAWETPAQEDCI